MKKKILILSIALAVAFSSGALFAAASIKIIVNGSTANTDAKLIDNTTYVPLRAVSEMLAADVKWDQKTKTVTITSGNVPGNSETVKTVEGITVEILRVEQDSDSLRVYLKYTNNSKNEISPAESLSRIVANGVQQDYDHNFNFERYYDKDVPNAPYGLEPGASAESVIFFKPVTNISTINITVSPEFSDIRFQNIDVIKQ